MRVYSNDEETTLDSERLPPLWRVKRSISRQLLQTSTLQILRLGTVRPAGKDTRRIWNWPSSTYATIIATLIQRDYVELENKRFYPTDVGKLVSGFLTNHFSDYVDYEFTAQLEDALDAVSRVRETGYHYLMNSGGRLRKP